MPKALAVCDDEAAPTPPSWCSCVASVVCPVEAFRAAAVSNKNAEQAIKRGRGFGRAVRAERVVLSESRTNSLLAQKRA